MGSKGVYCFIGTKTHREINARLYRTNIRNVFFGMLPNIVSKEIRQFRRKKSPVLYISYLTNMSKKNCKIFFERCGGRSSSREAEIGLCLWFGLCSGKREGHVCISTAARS